MPVGYLAREDARAYLDGLHALISGCATGCVGLRGVIAGGGLRDGRHGFLGVFLDHDPADFGVHHHFVAMQGELRTGFSQARATDLADDSYDLSWGDTLAADPWTAAAQIESLLVEERDPIDRHFMFAQLEKSLYRSRSSHADALDRFDDACRRHDAEMGPLWPVCRQVRLERVIEMYHGGIPPEAKSGRRSAVRRTRGHRHGDVAARPRGSSTCTSASRMRPRSSKRRSGRHDRSR